MEFIQDVVIVMLVIYLPLAIFNNGQRAHVAVINFWRQLPRQRVRNRAQTMGDTIRAQRGS